jgi:3-hydroxyacyl-CoA dehydrogenase
MERKWEHVVVLGAAGKMGSGIALLLLLEMALKCGTQLTLLDRETQGFTSLRKYLREHLQKYAERNINQLRKNYYHRKELIDNGEMIETFIEEGLDKVRFVTSLDECSGAHLIFEAILENLDVKSEIFAKVNKIADPQALYFSNTSSIPIHVLQEKSHLPGRLIGFHFYNPPAVQKLLELIIPIGTNEETKNVAEDIAKRLNKIVVYSADVAGFIGNGHFIREVSKACKMAEEKQRNTSLSEIIWHLDLVTRDFLIRPMGIFQLADYVGLDVIQHIARIMSKYQPGHDFKISLIDAMLAADIKGGQHGDGGQKDGIFAYQKGVPIKVYDLKQQKYVSLNPSMEVKLPAVQYSWKFLGKDKEKKEKLRHYFANLFGDRSIAGRLAIQFLENSRAIAHYLVESKVANSISDVDTVLQNGFFHLYGVDDPWKVNGEAK